MQESIITQPIQQMCHSVFKSGESTTTKNQFTGKWIELINRVEKNKIIGTENKR